MGTGKNGNVFGIITLLTLAFVCAIATAVLSVAILRAVITPVKYLAEMEKASLEFGVEKPVIMAFCLTESGFDSSAKSVKGAKGLMQITDPTAEFIGEMLGVEDYDLFDPQTNVRFGTYYIAYLSRKFFGIKEIAAAYNAGEGRVKEWLKNAEYSADGITLDKIPYRETAEYVKKICKSLKRYKKLYGKLLDN